MLDLIFGTIITATLEIIFSFLFEIFFESFFQPFRRMSNAHTVWSYFGIMLIGLIIGYLFSYLYPNRIINISSVPGLSLLIAPLLCGFSMKYLGNKLSGRGRETTYIATFWGGFLFAFMISIARFYYVGYSF